MAEEEQVFAEVMSLLEAEPSSGSAGGVVADLTAFGPDIPALASAAMITTKHIDLNSKDETKLNEIP